MKTKLVLLTCILITCFSNNLWPQTLSFAKSMGGSLGDEANSMAVDSSGNTYVTGSFQGTADFDPSTATYNLISAGGTDVFVAKINSSGNLVWAYRLGSSSSDIGKGISLDKNSNVYVTGFFNGTVDFDPGSGTNNLSSAGGSDAFILKLNSSGNFTWAKKTGGTNSEQSTCISVDGTGNILVAGNFSSSNCDFDPGAGSYTMTPAGGNDAFILKLNNNGNFVWAKQMGGTSGEGVYAITTNTLNNVYTTGWFQGTVDFDPGIGTHTLTSSGGVQNDIFILKMDSIGTFNWVKQMGDALSDVGNSIAVDAAGNVYTTGDFQDTVDFDPGTGTYPLISAGNRDIFISKLNAAGNFVWARNLGGTAHDYSYSISLDIAGNVYTSGRFQGTADFDPSVSTYTLSSAGGLDAFISKLDANGNYISANKFGANSSDYGNAICVDASGNIYLTGGFSSTVDFDPGGGITNLISAGSTDIFVLKLSQCPATTATISPSVCSSFVSPSGIYTYTASGTYTDKIPNSVGCDSIITIYLTIKNTSAVISATVCTSYLSPGGANLWTSSGTYYDTIPNSSGCDSLITVYLTIPVIDTTVTQNGITLIANATGANYQWINCSNNQPVSGATQQNFTPSSNGSYAVIITKNGCSDTSSCKAITSVGTSEFINKAPYTVVYPNPGKNIFTFRSSEKIIHISISDITGATVKENAIDQYEYSIDLGDLAGGIYIATLICEEGIVSMKFMKE